MHWDVIGIVAVPVLVILGGMWRTVMHITSLSHKVTTQGDDLVYVKAQLSPDSGHSTYDRVAQTEGAVNTLTVRFEDHLKQHAGEWR